MGMQLKKQILIGKEVEKLFFRIIKKKYILSHFINTLILLNRFTGQMRYNNALKLLLFFLQMNSCYQMY